MEPLTRKFAHVKKRPLPPECVRTRWKSTIQKVICCLKAGACQLMHFIQNLPSVRQAGWRCFDVPRQLALPARAAVESKGSPSVRLTFDQPGARFFHGLELFMCHHWRVISSAANGGAGYGRTRCVRHFSLLRIEKVTHGRTRLDL